jgi:hypothetical protein
MANNLSMLIISAFQQTNLPELFLCTVGKRTRSIRGSGEVRVVSAIRVACLMHTRYLCHENESFF